MMNKIICVVDNVALKGTGLKTEHGLAFWIETEYGTILFDTGQTADVLSNNMSLLIQDLGEEIPNGIYTVNVVVNQYARFSNKIVIAR